MKQKVLFLIALSLGLMGLQVQAQTIFSAVSPSYHTLYYKVVDQENHWVELINPNNTDGIGGEAWENYSAPWGNVVVPQTVTNGGITWTVKRIGQSAFASCSTVHRITLPEGIDSIKAYAFFATEIDSVNIPNTVTYIGSSNFHNPQLRYLHLPASLLYIDPWEQDGAGILAFSVEEGNQYYRSINGCLVREENNIVDLIAYPRGRVNGVVEIPEGVTRADWMPMGINNAAKLILPSTLTTICPFGWEMQIYDTIVLHGVNPSQLACSLYWTSRIELPCGSQLRYSASAWGQYSNLFVTSDYLPQADYSQTINYGESYSWGGLSLTERGVYEDTLQSVVEGCDSVHRVLTLNVVQTYRSDVLLTDGQSAQFHGLTVDRPGVYEVLVPGEGDFDSLFVLRASAQVNATVATVQLGGPWDGETLTLPAMESRTYVRGIDTITVTNIHQIIHTTVDTTIAEGGSYRGYTLAGVYQDTVYFADYDSIVRSRVSMTVNRPMDNCTVQLGGNQGGTYFNGESFTEVQVLPSENKTLLYTPETLGINILTFTDENYTNYSQYCGDFCNNTYQWGGRGYNGSEALYVGFGCYENLAFFRIALDSKAGEQYKFSFLANSCNMNRQILAVKVNGVQMSQVDSLEYYVEGTASQWGAFEHLITATGDTTVIELVNLQADAGDWFMDNFRLMKVYSMPTDTITISNIHGMVYDMVDVTINEGQSYRGHTLAGVYQDTILAIDADSIVRSRVSMTINRPMDNCIVQLGGNQEGSYFTGNEFYAAGAEVQVLPTESKTLLYSPETLGVNMLTFTDENYSNYSQYCGDYCSSPDCSAFGDWWDRGVDGSTAIYFRGSCTANLAFFRTTLNTRAGEQYLFRYMATAGGNPEKPILALKVNGVQMSNIDTLENCCNEPTWGAFEHLITATSDTTTIELVNLQGWNTEYWTNGVYHNEWFMDNFRLMKVYATPIDSITITNTHGLVRDTVDVTINEGGSYHGHTLAGVYQDTIIGGETDSIVYARVSMDINHSFSSGTTTIATNQEGRMWIGLDNNTITTQPTVTVQVDPTQEQRYVLTSLADGSNMQPNGDFEQWQNNWSSEYAWSDIPFQGSHYITLCDTCGRTGNGIAVKGSGLANKYFYTSEWVNLIMGHRYSFSYWAKSRATNPAVLDIAINDQQQEWLLKDTTSLSETIGEWKRFEHIFTARRTYSSLVRIVDLNTSSEGNEFFLDDVSIIDLTEAADAHRDTVTVHNVHQLHYATVDTTINEGENYNGYTTAGVYNDTVVLADYDSITRARVSYVLNTTGEGVAMLSSNREGAWIDLDNNGVYTDSTVSVYPTEVRHFGLLTPAQDTNLITNGDFEQGNTGFTSHYSYRPEPYPFNDDNTYYVGSYRISEEENNHFLHCHNYWYPRQGAYYSTTVSVTPNTWYKFSYRAGIESNTNNSNIIEVNEHLVAIDTFAHRSVSNWMGRMLCYSHLIYSGDTTMFTIVMDQRLENIFEFVVDDIVLTPLTVIDTITITNRHQLVYAIVDTTINEGENYNGHTLAGVYNDTIVLADYDSIIHTRVSYVLNTSGEGNTLLSDNVGGTWVDIDNGMLYSGDSVSVWPTEVRRFGQLVQVPHDTNLIVNGDFEQGNTGFSSYYIFRPLPYSLDDSTFMIGGYRIAQNAGNNYFHALYNHANNGAAYTTNVSVEPNSWYILSFKAVSTVCYADQGNMGPLFHVNINGSDVATKRFFCSYYDDFYSVTNCGDIEQSNTYTQLVYSDDTIMSIALRHDNSDYWGWYHFAYDDIVLTPLTVVDTITITNRHQLVYDTTRADICQGETLTVDSINFSTTGTYTLPTRYYTDSTVYPTLVVDVHSNYYPQLSTQICEGENYSFGSRTLTETGVYVDSLQSLFGCDSLVTLTLNVYDHTASLQTEDVCDSYQWHGAVYTASATVVDTIANVHGCDSVCTLNLTVRYSNSGDTVADVCDLFNWYGQNYTSSGTPTHTLTNAAGCDSTLTLNLTVRHSTTGSETLVVCDSITWQGTLRSASGDYVETLANAVGCDSTVTLHLTVNPTYQHTDAVFACDNQLPYLYHEQPLATAGDYEVHFQSVENCDSAVTVTLTVGATYQHVDQLTLCQSGMPYGYGVMTFMEDDTSGTYTVPFSSVEGCDSIINLNLTVHESEQTEIYVVTVQATNNLVIWEPEAAVDHYNIYRESSTSGIYNLAAEVPYDEGGMWLDSTSDARSRSYRYRMTSVDSCGVESAYSVTHKTMHLTINQGQGNSWNLVWTEYEGTSYSTYHIYRGTSYDDLQLIDEMPAGGNTTYTDNNAPTGNVYYQIVVLLSPGAKGGSKDGNGVIRSNIATNDQTGIGDVVDSWSVVTVVNKQIVVETSPGLPIRVFDVAGRRLHDAIATGRDNFEVPTTGVYLVRIGSSKTQRVVVEK